MSNLANNNTDICQVSHNLFGKDKKVKSTEIVL